jgi:hypothetical protein
MNDILQQHDEAMALAEEGDALKEAGDITNAQFLYREAMLTELAALEICKERNHGMKSLSVLYRNAALLALKCGDAAKARSLVCSALVLNPPGCIETELRSLLMSFGNRA